MTSTVQCWCWDDIPPYSCLAIKSIMNMVAYPEPCAVIWPQSAAGQQAYGNYEPAGLSARSFVPVFRNQAWVGGAGNEEAAGDLYFRAVNLFSGYVTNGPIYIPAKTVFAADSLMRGVHWLAYASDADPTQTWFCRSIWSLTHVEELPPTLVALRRIGKHDAITKCVPVVMEPYHWLHTFLRG